MCGQDFFSFDKSPNGVSKLAKLNSLIKVILIRVKHMGGGTPEAHIRSGDLDEG